jgi:protein gp37
MGNRTEIAWTDSTYNHWEGCQKVGPGCDNCYAEARNARFGGGQAVNWGPGAPRRLTSVTNRNNLRRWNAEPFLECNCGWRGSEKDERKAAGCPACGHRLMLMKARRRVFCSSLSDVFDNAVAQDWRDAMFAEMAAAPNLDFLVLTKRIGNVRKMVPASWLKSGGWPAHVWIGATIVDQIEAHRDIPKLVDLPAHVRFLSMEPLLGPVDLSAVLVPNGILRNMVPAIGKLQWVIAGGESGPEARPMHPAWARALRDQCADAGVPFLFKQWGEWYAEGQVLAQTVRTPLYGRRLIALDGDERYTQQSVGMHKVGKKAAGRKLDGVVHNGFPSPAEQGGTHA